MLDNIGLKLTAFLASVGLFSIVHGAEDAQRSIFVDVVAILPPESSGKMLVSELPDQVKVTLRGSRSQINEIRRDDVPAIQVSLSDTSRRYLYLDPAAVEVPAGVSIVQLAPATVPLVWADAAERSVPITPRVVGQPPEGHAVKQHPVVVPREVSIHGPEQDVENLSTVYTEPVDITGLKPGAHERQVPLERPPQHISYQEVGAVTVKLEIGPEIAERLFRRMELEALGNGGARLRPQHVDVTLRGRQELLEGIDPEHLVPYVELEGLNEQTGTQLAPVKLRGVPKGVEVETLVPQDVLVKLPP